MEQSSLDNIILALLFASDEPLSVSRISSVLDDVPPPELKDSLERLEARFGGSSSAIRLEHVGGGFQLCTSPSYSEYVARLYRGRRKQRLSRAAMETLAIIAYRQPVTRADIETVRGVACGGVITTLMERSLIRIVGKARVLGSPFLYGTTQEFLEYLGLNSLKDLPSMEDLEALLEKEAASEPADEAVPGENERAKIESEAGEYVRVEEPTEDEEEFFGSEQPDAEGNGPAPAPEDSSAPETESDRDAGIEGDETER